MMKKMALLTSFAHIGMSAFIAGPSFEEFKEAADFYEKWINKKSKNKKYNKMNKNLKKKLKRANRK